ncbi:hypothetical protein P7K49_000670 [Saguinus oedipus]|uniref:Uncharacterized protein n=1 Tax=Saguinus oedipus TaxID=9490 RepID=A0ABQ9WCC6_SAGOE|nr:hypothetical protein P7K49_000670 [Saguinus oedipus]
MYRASGTRYRTRRFLAAHEARGARSHPESSALHHELPRGMAPLPTAAPRPSSSASPQVQTGEAGCAGDTLCKPLSLPRSPPRAASSELSALRLRSPLRWAQWLPVPGKAPPRLPPQCALWHSRTAGQKHLWLPAGLLAGPCGDSAVGAPRLRSHSVRARVPGSARTPLLGLFCQNLLISSSMLSSRSPEPLSSDWQPGLGAGRVAYGADRLGRRRRFS